MISVDVDDYRRFTQAQRQEIEDYFALNDVALPGMFARSFTIADDKRTIAFECFTRDPGTDKVLLHPDTRVPLTHHEVHLLPVQRPFWLDAEQVCTYWRWFIPIARFTPTSRYTPPKEIHYNMGTLEVQDSDLPFKATIKLVDSAGTELKLAETAVWTVDTPSVVTLEVAGDGLSAIGEIGAPGSTTITAVSRDADGETKLVFQGTVVVVEGAAVMGEIDFEGGGAKVPAEVAPDEAPGDATASNEVAAASPAPATTQAEAEHLAEVAAAAPPAPAAPPAGDASALPAEDAAAGTTATITITEPVVA
jgi:hypothetical protein